ncbi:hypothetical protein [Actinoplanes teichomyceticus]|uniref:Uncharacterized protein n=1 Tax=Actinoplanes teichomyceticus TaxID=1867 RepID=A0A561WL98_ACTTI|nr:hypothetical protein [Actinoplanes teichomyceticus]TWG24647.1 hypothetical protein FHX34_1021207 [Actinoplanes teichomyceticus]GIF14690.1 hypothetical protein Ate01nite_47220 [Actinoplanes teichomyceticus]
MTEFREIALGHGMPRDAIDYWVSLARPCLSLDGDGDGPVMGYFGGRPALPAAVAWPAGHAHLALFSVCSREDLAARRFETVELVSDFLG